MSVLSLISCTDSSTKKTNVYPYQTPKILTTRHKDGCPPQSAGPLGNSWCWAMPNPQGNIITDHDFGDGRFAFIGDNATVITSQDLHSYKNYNFSDQFLFPFYDVAYSDNKLVVAHPGGTYVTSDYEIWTLSDITFSALSLHYAEGTWVAAGISDSIAVSNDGISWTQYPLPIPTDLQGQAFLNKVYYANQQWIVAGNKGMIFTSKDTKEWSAAGNRLPIDIDDIVYADHLDTWIAVGSPDISIEDISNPTISKLSAISSRDTYSWAALNTPAIYGLSSVSYNGTKILASSELGRYFTTNDGASWQEHGERSPLLGSRNAYRYFTEEDLWVNAGAGGRIASSNDAMLWTEHVRPLLDQIHDIHYSTEAGFLAVGNTLEDEAGIIYSQDGISWGLQLIPDASPLLDVIRIKNVWVISDISGNILSSSDGIVWNIIHRSIHSINHIAFDAISERAIAVGNQGTLLVSDNLSHWEQKISPTDSDINSVHFESGKWVAVGDSGIFYSDTGDSWNQAVIPEEEAGSFNEFSHVNYFNGKWLAFRGIYDLFYSENGIDWQTENIKSASTTSSFVAQGVIRTTTLSGVIYESKDGLTWLEADLSTKLDWDSGITFNGSRWFATSRNGSIRFSND